MSSAMRYDHARMADHAVAQQGIVNHMRDLQNQALNVLAGTQDFWSDLGAGAYQEAHRSIVQAYESVFDTINRHAMAINKSSGNAGTADSAVASGFSGI